MTAFCTSGSSEKSSGCRPQPTLVIWPAGRTRSRASFSDDGNPCGIDDQVETVAVAEISHPLDGIFVVRAENRVCADPLGDLKPVRVGGDPDHQEMSSSGKLRHHRAKQADRPRPDHGDRVARAQVRIDADGVIGHTTWLGQRRFFQTQRGRERVQAARRHFDKGCHGAIDPIAEAEPFRFQVIESLANERRVVGQHRGRFAHYPVALFEAPHATAELGNITSEFMAQDHGVINRPTLLADVLMEIAAADAYSVYPEQNVVFPDAGNGNFTKFYRVRFFCVS